MNKLESHTPKSIFHYKDTTNNADQSWKKDPTFTAALQEICLSGQVDTLIDREIVITGHVLGDGLGDKAHMDSMAKTLLKLFPEQKIAILPLVARCHKGNIQPVSSKNVETVFTFSKSFLSKIKESFSLEKNVLESINDSLSISKIPSRPKKTQLPIEILERIKNAALIIKMSADITDKGYTDLIKEDQIKRKECFFPEYGSQRFSCRHYMTMGLERMEYGIFIKKIPKNKSITQLKEKKLLQFLFSKDDPNEEDVNNYFSQNIFNLSYVHNYDKGRVIKTLIFLLNMSAFDNGNKNLDICVPLKKINFNFNVADYECFAMTNVGKISLFMKDENKNLTKKQEIKIGNGEREIRLINCFPLSRQDMKTLMCFEKPEGITNEIVGCTGDSSFVEALSYSKIPFYELRSHKYPFYASFMSLVEETVGKESPYFQYLKEIADIGIPDETSSIDEWFEPISKRKRTNCKIIASRLYGHLTDPNFMSDVKKVAELIRSEHAAQVKLMNVVIIKLLELYKSNFISNLYNEYLEHKISIPEVKQKFLEDAV